MERLSHSTIVLICLAIGAAIVFYQRPSPPIDGEAALADVPARTTTTTITTEPEVATPRGQPTRLPNAKVDANPLVPANRMRRLPPSPDLAGNNRLASHARSADHARSASHAESVPDKLPTMAEPAQREIVPVVVKVESSGPPAATSHDSPTRRFYSDIQNFLRPMEADPGWVVDPTDHASTVARRAELAAIDLPPQVAARAREMLAEATSLADRGALFAARQQFLDVIRVTCQSLDAKVGDPLHSRALVQGMRALEEADDFAMGGDQPESDIHLLGFIEGHRTPVLKNADVSKVTSLLAMQQYYRYAFEQLTLAGNNESVASDALYALGRIELLASAQESRRMSGGPKSLAYFHAALTIDPQNGRAANELGVMLARRGRVHDAHQAFVQAANSQRTPESLKNLAAIQAQMGDRAAAHQTFQLAQQIESNSPKMAINRQFGGVQWVDNAAFNSALGSDMAESRVPSPQATNQAVSHQTPMAGPQPNRDSRRSPPPPAPKERKRSFSKSDLWDF